MTGVLLSGIRYAVVWYQVCCSVITGLLCVSSYVVLVNR